MLGDLGLSYEQAVLFQRRKDAGESWAAMVRGSPFSHSSSLRRGVTRALGERPASASAPRPVDETLLRVPPPLGAAESLLDTFSLAQERMDEFDTTVAEVHTPNLGDKPIAVVFTGDWHIGHMGTDHKRLKADLARWQDTERLFVAGMGDYCNNFLPAGGTPRATHEQVIQQPFQGYVLRELMEHYLQNQLLCLVTGNHDDWTYNMTASDPVQALAADLRVPYMGHGGRLFIRLGTQTYLGNVAHRFAGRSAITPTNDLRRMDDEAGGGDFDALAHTHKWAVQETPKGGEARTYLRSGTYLIRNRWVQSVGAAFPAHYDPALMPAIVLFPDRHDIVPFKDYRHAITFLVACAR